MYLEADDRFAHLYRKDESVLSNVKRIVRTYAAIRPLDAEFKPMVFSEADAMPGEMQQALRRTMERVLADMPVHPHHLAAVGDPAGDRVPLPPGRLPPAL